MFFMSLFALFLHSLVYIDGHVLIKIGHKPLILTLLSFSNTKYITN